MQPKHDRKMVFGMVDLVKGRVRNDRVCIPVREFLEKLIVNTGFLKEAAFLWIGVIFRYGIKNDLKAEFQRINKKYGDLSIALELDMEILQWADRNNLDLLRDIFMIASLEALLHIGKKYKLPTQIFETERAKYGNIPDTLEACESYVSPVSGELTTDV
jgi:hypothetical protein